MKLIKWSKGVLDLDLEIFHKFLLLDKAQKQKEAPSPLHLCCSCILGCGKVLTAEHTHLIWDTIYLANFIYWSLVKLFNL